jgi:hypothetical protein
VILPPETVICTCTGPHCVCAVSPVTVVADPPAELEPLLPDDVLPLPAEVLPEELVVPVPVLGAPQGCRCQPVRCGS